MAKGYLIAQITVTDMQAYSRYADIASDLLEVYGAKAIVNPSTAIVKEGEPKARTMIFEFESFEKANAFFDSQEYLQAKALRIGSADADFIIIEGTE